jgi:cell fate (sporulation/competence/biofilm development) regulator YmcA (YheA/YmcA/DUF963 family)
MSDDTTPICSSESVSEQLAEINHIADPSKKVEALIELASQLLPSPSEVLAQVLEDIRDIGDEKNRDESLITIVLQLVGIELRPFQEEYIVIQDIKDERCNAQALDMIAPLLTEIERFKVLIRALNLVPHKNIVNAPKNCIEILAAIASKLLETGPQLVQQILTGLENRKDDRDLYAYAHALVIVAPHLPETQRLGVLQKALTTANEISDPDSHTYALVAIAPHLPPAERFKALDDARTAAREIWTNQYRTYALVAIAPHLPPAERFKTLVEAEDAAFGIGDVQSSIKAWVEIVSQLPETERFEKLKELWVTLQSVGNSEERLNSEEYLKDENNEGDKHLAEALAEIAPKLSEVEPQFLEQALSLALDIRYEEYRVKALAAIAAHLPEAERFKAFEQSLTDIQYIKDLKYGTEVLVASSAKTLAAIVRQLPETEPQLLEQAVTTSNQTVKSNWLLVLPAFLSRYPEERRSRLLEWALANLQTTQSVHQKIDILNTISPFLSGTEPYLLQKAVTIAQDIQNIPQDIQNNVIPQLALAVIAPRLPETQHLEIVEQALAVADNITDAKAQAEALAKIAPQLLSKKRFKEVSKGALTAAQNISDPESRVKVLVKIAPQLTEIDRFDALEQSLNTIQNIKTDKELTETLSLIISQLPSPKTQLLQQVLTTAQGIKDPEHSVSALVEIAAIVPETELQQILTTARSIKDERYFPQALALIAHRLPETQRFDIWEQASTAAHNIRDDGNRARTLAAIAPSLPETQRFDAYSQALTATQKISESKSRAKTLYEIVRNLPDNEPELFQQALSAAQEIEEVVGYREEDPLMLWSLEDVGRGHILDLLSLNYRKLNST